MKTKKLLAKPINVKGSRFQVGEIKDGTPDKIGCRISIGLCPVKTGQHNFNQSAQRATVIIGWGLHSSCCLITYDSVRCLHPPFLQIFFLSHTVLCSVCPLQPLCIYLPTPPFSSRRLSVSLYAIRPRLWRDRRRVMFGLSVWLLVSVSGAAGSSDSARGAAGPSRVQPSPCDTLSVTDPLRLVTWHPLLPIFVFAHRSTTPPLSQWPFHCHFAVSHSVTHLLLH